MPNFTRISTPGAVFLQDTAGTGPRWHIGSNDTGNARVDDQVISQTDVIQHEAGQIVDGSGRRCRCSILLRARHGRVVQ